AGSSIDVARTDLRKSTPACGGEPAWCVGRSRQWQNTRGLTMLRNVFLPSVLIFVFAMSAAVSAHHSTAAYQTKTVTMKSAVVKKFAWQNPHCVLSFDVKDDRGRTTTWSVEGGSPSALSRIGWNRTAVSRADPI